MKTLNNKNNLAIVNKYNKFCETQGLLQIINSYTHVSTTSSSIIDHILTNSHDRISQSGVIETTFSDHYSIFCTRKITRNKHNRHKTIKIRSLKNYDKESYLEKPDQDKNSNIDDIYANYVKQLGDIIDSVVLLREIRIKSHTPEWFDGEILA